MQLSRTLFHIVFIIILIILTRFAGSANVNNTSSARRFLLNEEHEVSKKILKKCNNNYFNWICLRIEFLKILDSLSAREEVRLLSGVSIVRDVSRQPIKNSALISDAARGYPHNPNARFNAYILRKLYNYLQTHYLRLKLLNQQPIEEGRKGDDYGGGGGGYGGHKKGGYEAMIAAAMMIKGSLMAMAIGGVALIAGKALMAALMALTMAAAAGLKGMSSGGGKSTTYEIVAKPIHTSGYTQSMSYDEGHMMNNNGGSSGYGGYSR
uniref:Osiris 16 n=1 Tax=Glossina palpalis gambiensis TaxID=67801 RepID=A0A1B0B2X2_9MUSC